MCFDQAEYPTLANLCFSTPAIDNHAHNICKEEMLDKYPIESIFSEAEGEALIHHAQSSISAMTAARQLSGLYDCESNWKDLKEKIQSMSLEDRCKLCFDSNQIEMILLDDLLKGAKENCHDYKWHDQFTKKKNKRIVRLEVLMEDAIRFVFFNSNFKTQVDIKALDECCDHFLREVYQSIMDSEVVAFKSIICYRSGLDVSPLTTPEEALNQLIPWIHGLRNSSDHHPTLRLNKETKKLNDWLLIKAFEEISTHPRESDFILPVQFHVGLGDKSCQLTKSRPSSLQDLIERFPTLPIVLLHASYPFTREAGYLASVYESVWLDFGEIFPMISTLGQIDVMKEIFEVCPTSKLLWSSDAHFLPEGFYLASLQARNVLYKVLVEMIKIESIDEVQAGEIVQRVLFLNSNGLYRLGLSFKVEE
ncbi:amidohydrolase-domain-containing protein [Melampsora americana]|nr:amidohydrolase-domain-containing protein [Melampsora americana]